MKALIVALFSIAVLGQPQAYRVLQIVDGDTLVLTELGTVRLIGVDTPETVDPRKPVEQFGRASTAFLTGLALGQDVRVEYDQTRKDRFDRPLAYLYLADGRSVNREVIRFGYGHLYTEFPFRLMDDFREAAREARQSNSGLWAAGLGVDDVKTVETRATASPVGLLGAAAAPAPPPAARASDVVYVSKSGSKYHRDGCNALYMSRIATTLGAASAKYGACAICKPPTLATAAPGTGAPQPVISSPRPPAPPVATPVPVSRQCAATTKKGARCSRQASAGSAYCWQHGKTH